MDIDKVAEEPDARISEVDKRIERLKENVEKTFKALDKDISDAIGENNETKLNAVIENLKKQRENVDLSIIQGSKRLPDEDFAAYKDRIKREKKMLKQYSRGHIVHESIFDGQKVGHFKKD